MTDPNSHPVKVPVAYYSATGHVHALGKALAAGPRDAGAEVRVRHVEELAPGLLISQNQAWGRHRSEVGEEPTATLADLEWADGIAFGTPTRFGNVAAQLTMFLDEAGELWQRRADQQGGNGVHLIANRAPGTGVDDSRPQQHVLPLGRDCAPARLHGYRSIQRRRQPLRCVYTSGTRLGEPEAETRAVAIAQGGRLARVARAIASGQTSGILDDRVSVVAETESRSRGELNGTFDAKFSDMR